MIIDYSKILQSPEVQEKLFETGIFYICYKYAENCHVALEVDNTYKQQKKWDFDNNVPESGENLFWGEMHILQITDDGGDSVKWCKIIGNPKYEFSQNY